MGVGSWFLHSGTRERKSYSRIFSHSPQSGLASCGRGQGRLRFTAGPTIARAVFHASLSAGDACRESIEQRGGHRAVQRLSIIRRFDVLAHSLVRHDGLRSSRAGAAQIRMKDSAKHVPKYSAASFLRFITVCFAPVSLGLRSTGKRRVSPNWHVPLKASSRFCQ